MPSYICIAGKGGVGKTTFISVFIKKLLKYYPGKSILAVDADFNCDLAYTLGLKFHKALAGIRTQQGNHNNSQEEYDFMVADYILPVQENLDVLTIGDIFYPTCNNGHDLLKNALTKTLHNYDFVLLDTYESPGLLNQICKAYLDTLIVVSDTSKSSIIAALNIENTFKSLACPEQVGIILNKVRERNIPDYIYSKLKEDNIDILGVIPYDEGLRKNEYEGLFLWKQDENNVVENALEQILYRVNLPNR